MDKIYVNGMAFYGYHGVFPEETKLGQRFFIDLTLQLDLEEAGKTDDLTKSVNYGEVYNDVRTIVEGEPVKLIETLAVRIIKCIFEKYPLVQTIKVCVKKPEAPITGILDFAAVELERNRT